MTETEAILSVQGIVIHLASWYANKWNLDRDELIGEGEIEALKAIRSFQEERGNKLDTLVYKYVDQHFRSKVRYAKWRRRVGRDTPQLYADVQITEDMEVPNKHRTHYEERLHDKSKTFHELFMDLTSEAKWVIDIIFDRKIGSKSHLYKTLRNEYGWQKYLIQCVYDEIKDALS